MKKIDYIFPTIVILCVIALVYFGIHGSSIGMYYKIYAPEYKDKDLLLFEPRGIRADEWMTFTPMLFSQIENGYAVFNSRLGPLGQKVLPMQVAPVYHWSAIFKPVDYLFFAGDVTRAFAYRWWFGYAFMLISIYTYLKTQKINFLHSSILSTAIVAAPFINWWYLPHTSIVVACTFSLISVFKKALEEDDFLIKNIYLCLILFLGLVLVMPLYPPFQIPAVLIIIFHWCADFYCYYSSNTYSRSKIAKSLIFMLPWLGLFLWLLGIYFYEFKDVVYSISNTIYPGNRHTSSGGLDIVTLFGGIFNHNLLNDSSQPMPFINQSEGSNFILIAPFILPFIIVNRSIFDKLSCITKSLSILLIIFLLWTLIPGIDMVGKILLLDRVPHIRLLMGIGILSYIISIRIIWIDQVSFGFRNIMLSLVFYLCVNFSVGYNIMQNFPNFISKSADVTIPVIIGIILIYALTRNLKNIFALVFLIFSLWLSIGVHPIYRGVSIFTNPPKEVKKYKIERRAVAVYEDIVLNGLVTGWGLDNFTAVNVYPQMTYWEQFDKTLSRKNVYNRYSHVVLFPNNDPNDISLGLINFDATGISIDPCHELFSNIKPSFIFIRNPSKGCIKNDIPLSFPLGRIHISK